MIRFPSNDSIYNQTGFIIVEQETRVELSELRRDQSYTKYYTFLTRLVITGIIPILALLFFNINIYLGLRASRRRRSQHMLTPNRRKTLRGDRESSELNFSLIL